MYQGKTNENLKILVKLIKGTNTTDSNAKSKKKQKTIVEWISLIYPSLLFIVFAILLNLSPESIQHIKLTISHFSLFLKHYGLHIQDKVLVDALVAFINWPITYFFIRRALNPEIGIVSAFEKYGNDTLYGAFSAAAAVFIKDILTV